MDRSEKIKNLKERIDKMQSQLKELIIEDEPIPYPPLSFNRIKDYYEWLNECKEYEKSNDTIYEKIHEETNKDDTKLFKEKERTSD
jgi:hypothetical protein